MKKLCVAFIMLIMIFTVSCGDNDRSSEENIEPKPPVDSIIIANATFSEPLNCDFKISTDGSYVAAVDSMESVLMVSSDSNEGVYEWNVTPTASTVEELFSRRITNENSGNLEIVEIDGVYGCIVTSDDLWGKGAYFVYEDRIYIVSAYRDF